MCHKRQQMEAAILIHSYKSSPAPRTAPARLNRWMMWWGNYSGPFLSPRSGIYQPNPFYLLSLSCHLCQYSPLGSQAISSTACCTYTVVFVFCPAESLCQSNFDTHFWQTDSTILKWIHQSVSATLAHKHHFTSVQNDLSTLSGLIQVGLLSAFTLIFPAALLTTR